VQSQHEGYGSIVPHGTGRSRSALVSFAPWIAIWIIGGHNHMRLAAGVALVACVGLIAWEYLSGLRPKSLDWGTLGIIAVLFVIALVAPQSWSNKWFVPVANGALFALMLGTIVVGRPFAAEYGKESAPPEVWDTPAFRKATLGISVAWTVAVGAIFVGSLITALKPSTEAWSTWVVTVAAIIIALKFQHWYPEQVARQQQGPAAAGAVP
jgi:hypothetical protein